VIPCDSRSLVLAAALLAGCEPSARTHDQPSPRATRLFVEHPAAWFEGYSTAAQVSPDGRWAAYSSGGGPLRILDLETGGPAPANRWMRIDSARTATFGPGGRIAWLGRHGAQTGWFMADSGSVTPVAGLSAEARPRWSADGRIAWARSSDSRHEVVVGTGADQRAYPLPVPALSLAWTPDGRSLAILAGDTSATVRLLVLDLQQGQVRTVARELDGSPYVPMLSVAPDGRRAFVALASDGTPRPELRHQPDADRDLAIYAVDLASGERHVVADTPGDDFAPQVVRGALYWSSTSMARAAVVLPIGGGTAWAVAEGEVPTWRPDGRQIGFCYGGWRIVDWALNLDGGAVDVDGQARPMGQPRAFITGYHEDFPPVWSPDGHWVAFHSHRPASAVTSYDAAGSSDDIWLRRAGAPARDSTERRLTDFGWEAGSPDWSPDGRTLLFTSWVKGGTPYRSFAWTVTIDPRSGRPIDHARLPLPAPIHGAEMAAWSPDGREIAIEEKLSEERHALWVVRRDGTRPRKVLDYGMPTYGGVDWTPDGRSLVYSAMSGDRMQVFVVPVSGGTPRQLTTESANVLHPQVSPDGRFVAATRILQERTIWRLELAR